jgi:hypothetical protein
MPASITIHQPVNRTDGTARIADILARGIRECSGARVVPSGPADLDIHLDIVPGIGAEGFAISDAPGGVRVTGNDARGLLYGVGRLLHGSRHAAGEFAPGPWRGRSVPAKPVRGIYLATHFHNWYHEAPLDEVTRYVEDLALWGFNSVLVWFGMEEYDGIDDPKAREVLGRLHALLKIFKDLGLDASMGCICNDGYANSPKELRADDSTVDHAGYHTRMGNRIYNLGNELCPSKPGVPEMEIRFCKEKLDVFTDIGVDYWIITPYDNGGCTCPQCSPWGINGYLRMAEKLARTYRGLFPRGKVVLGTWYFDRWANGEWEGITERFNREKPDWVDYIMADDYGGKYPPYPLEHGSPGGLPMLNFPEISMYLHQPWGGFGANPLPGYLQSLWDVTKGVLSGGFLYSEGIFEDMNKVMVSQLYWDPDKPTAETVREYVAFHFSPDAAEKVGAAVRIFERNLERKRKDVNGSVEWVMKNTEEAEEAFRLISEVEAILPEGVRSSWRWRLLSIRALVDRELVNNGFRVSAACAAAFRELTAMYHAERARWMLAPPGA